MSSFVGLIFYYLGLTFDRWVPIKVVLLAIALIWETKRSGKKIWGSFLFFLLGIGVSAYFKQNLFFSNIGMVVVRKENYLIVQTFSGRYYVSAYQNSYDLFSVLKIKGSVSDYGFTFYESQMNFNEYLKENLVYKQIVTEKIEVIASFRFPFCRWMNEQIDLYPEEAGDLLSSLFSGSMKNKELQTIVYRNQLNYYLSISSYHLFFLCGIVRKILRIKLSDKSAEKGIIFLLCFFCVLSDWKLSVFRFTLYRMIAYRSECSMKKAISVREKTGKTFLFLGLIAPNSISSSYFLYSFPLLCFLSVTRESLLQIEKGKRKRYYFLLIQLFLIPIQFLIDGKCSMFSFVFCLVFGPVILLVFLLFPFGFFPPFKPVVSFFARLIWKMIYLFDRINLIVYASYFLPLILLIFPALFYCIYLIYTGRRKRIFLPVNAMIIIAMFPLIPFENGFERSVSFINVGQGDSVLIKDGNQHILIDTGGVWGNDLAVQTLIPFFRKHHVYRIDYLFVTHGDYDHSGALKSLAENFKINEIFSENDFTEIALPHFTLYNLNHYNYLWDDENSRSMVLYMDFFQHGFLFMGDAPKKIEREIVKNYPDLKVDYLKAGHHGSNTSTDESFISHYRPCEAIISVGLNNRYNHPNEETLRILNEYDVRIRRTDTEGTIVYSFR